MGENKTKPTSKDVSRFIDAVPEEWRRADAYALVVMMEQITGEPPRMWGPSIVGFGKYRYRYESGREGEAAIAGFSPRAKELVVYLPADPRDKDALLARLGKHKAGKCCLYIKRLSDLDQDVLRTLVAQSMEAIRERYPD
jgi:hypothetical protein